MSVYASPEERALEWAYINAAFALKEHQELPAIDRSVQPNKTKRKAMQRERGLQTSKLRAKMQAARADWHSWKLRNDPRSTCPCGKNLKTHRSRQDPLKFVCHVCLLQEPAFVGELLALNRQPLPVRE